MNLDDILAEFAAWSRRPDLVNETNLLARAEALDFLDFVCRLLPHSHEPTVTLTSLCAEAQALAEQLTTVNRTLFQQVRSAIQQRTLLGADLRAYCNRFTEAKIAGNDGSCSGYDGLDLLLDGIFGLQEAPPPTAQLAAEMVHCQETPARVILDLVDQIPFGPADRFYDLGCGLGQVVMLVNLLSGVAAYGIEVEPAFVTFARQQATALGLQNVHFVNADAQVADYSAGTVFFLFTPFRGQMMQRVLARLQMVAADHPIRICTFGPCTPIVAQEHWLRPQTDYALHEDQLAIFDSQLYSARA